MSAKLLERPPQALVVDLQAFPEMGSSQRDFRGGQLGEDAVGEGVDGSGGLLCDLEMRAGAVGPGDEAEGQGFDGGVRAVLESQA